MCLFSLLVGGLLSRRGHVLLSVVHEYGSEVDEL